MNISKNIFAIRNDKRLTQSEVALRMGIDQPNYARLEKRDVEMSIKQLSDIAVALGVTVDDILHYGEEKTQIVDNEKIKELENKVLLLEKDLEISNNRYELRTNMLKNGFSEILNHSIIVYKISHSFYYRNVRKILSNHLTNHIKLIEELNLFSTNSFLKNVKYALENAINGVGSTVFYSIPMQVLTVYGMLNEEEKDEVLLKELRNLYTAISVNFEWSEAKYNQAIEECKLLGYDFTKTEQFKVDLMKFQNYKEAKNLYEEKIKPLTLTQAIEINKLAEYKDNPNYPPQTGFFRIENL